MSSDRPGSTYSTSALIRGDFQLQAGFAYLFTSMANDPTLFLEKNSHLLPLSLNLRFGFSDKMELEFAVPQQFAFVTSSAENAEPSKLNYLIGLGLFSRFALIRENESGWSMGARFGFQYDSFKTSGITANVDLTAQKNFKSGFGLSSTLSYFQLFQTELNPNSQWLQYALNGNYGITKALRLYADLLNTIDLDKNGAGEVFGLSNYGITLGAQYFLNKDLALDAGFGFGQSMGSSLDSEFNLYHKKTDAFLASAGVSYRF